MFNSWPQRSIISIIFDIMVQLRFISVAVVVILLIQLAICQKNTCPMAYAPDGTQYDLTAIASK